MPDDSTNIDRQRDLQNALTRLAILSRQRPELQQLGDVTTGILKTLFASGATAQWVNHTPHTVHGLPDGVPLLHSAEITFDVVSLQRHWRDVCTVLARGSDMMMAQRLAAALASGVISPADDLRLLIRHGADRYQQRLRDHSLDGPIGLTVLRLCGLPQLEPLARECEPLWMQASWHRGHCPFCASPPLLAEYRGLEQLRWLRCGLCAAQWTVDRAFCPFCENRDHRRLSERFVDGQEAKYRVNVCGACGRFLPALSTLERLTAPGLLVAEAETLHLRFAAERSPV